MDVTVEHRSLLSTRIDDVPIHGTEPAIKVTDSPFKGFSASAPPFEEKKKLKSIKGVSGCDKPFFCHLNRSGLQANQTNEYRQATSMLYRLLDYFQNFQLLTIFAFLFRRESFLF